MIYEFGPDKSFWSEYEKVDLIIPFCKYIQGNLVMPDLLLLKEYNFSQTVDSAKGSGKIIQKPDGLYFCSINKDSFVADEERNIIFKIESLGEKYFQYKVDDYLLSWASNGTVEVTRVILTNDKKIYLKAHRLKIPVFRNITILYAGIELGLWDLNVVKNTYNIWSKDPQAVPSDCDTWEILIAKHGKEIENNASYLKDILEKSHH